jgi:uncharacterized RDD family membrane protein YckC
MRFDEVELEPVPLGIEDDTPPLPLPAPGDAPRGRRLLALLTDLSLFAALTLALSPLLPQPYAWTHLAALAGFVVVLSYYYFVGTWLLWGKTIGGAIFDVRVVPGNAHALSLRDASIRWAAVYLSLASAGVGFALAALPSRLSLPDRVSNTRCVVG